MTDRRSFLRSLVSVPLIGGGLTLIGQPSAPVPLVQAAAMPTLGDPRQRALYAWEAFSGAMRELTTGADGWIMHGAGERFTPLPGVPAEAWVLPCSLHYVTRQDPRFDRPSVTEHHRHIPITPDALARAEQMGDLFHG